MILGNSITANRTGIVVGFAAPTIGGTSQGAGNTISANSAYGILVKFGGGATIIDDSITGNHTGIMVGDNATDTCLVTAQDDDLSGNTTAGVTNIQTATKYAVTATNDWWGSLHGPTTKANPGGNGTSVSSNVRFSPWIGVYSNSATVGFDPTGVTLYAVPTRLVFVKEPSATASQGVDFATQPVVEAEDASGRLGINFDAATVSGLQAVMTLNTISGTGTLAGPTSVSPSGGLASFSGLNITAAGTYTLAVSSSGFGTLKIRGTSTQIIVTDPGPPTFDIAVGVGVARAGSAQGTPVTRPADTSRPAIGSDAWATSQPAVSAAASNGTVHVLARTSTSGPTSITQDLAFSGVGGTVTFNGVAAVDLSGWVTVTMAGLTLTGSGSGTWTDTSPAPSRRGLTRMARVAP
jgi:hypothetical protein